MEFEIFHSTAVSSEAWAKLREWAILAGKGRLLPSGSVVLASLKAAVFSCLLHQALHGKLSLLTDHRPRLVKGPWDKPH